jgi:hypothetical protein
MLVKDLKVRNIRIPLKDPKQWVADASPSRVYNCEHHKHKAALKAGALLGRSCSEVCCGIGT